MINGSLTNVSLKVDTFNPNIHRSPNASEPTHLLHSVIKRLSQLLPHRSPYHLAAVRLDAMLGGFTSVRAPAAMR